MACAFCVLDEHVIKMRRNRTVRGLTEFPVLQVPPANLIHSSYADFVAYALWRPSSVCTTQHTMSIGTCSTYNVSTCKKHCDRVRMTTWKSLERAALFVVSIHF